MESLIRHHELRPVGGGGVVAGVVADVIVAVIVVVAEVEVDAELRRPRLADGGKARRVEVPFRLGPV